MAKQGDRRRVAIIGGGPAGSVAALVLRKLGREAVIFERAVGPRYRIGESLLPGTMSILYRLGVWDKVAAAGFTKKRAATFLWGTGQSPWSFTFATPKTAPWVFDHALQVTRAEFDRIILDAAVERGAELREGHEVTDVEVGENGEGAVVRWKDGAGREGTEDAAYLIDASGSTGVVARKLKLRRWDEYYRNLAVWSYWKGGRRYKGDLEGNIFSVSFQDGWMWIIPLKDDLYSVGVVTGVENSARLRELGAQQFYAVCLAKSRFATDTLAGATQCDEMHVFRDWAYEASRLAMGRTFLCGDSGCFIDPLFSQGVHLSAYSALLAGSSIHHLYDHPEDQDTVLPWYDRTYRDAYQGYHKFLSAFYAQCDEPDSAFWASRRLSGAGDARLHGKEWWGSLTGRHADVGRGDALEELGAGAATLKQLWDHGTGVLTEEMDQQKLSLRRLQWANEQLRTLRRIAALRWAGDDVPLVRGYHVHQETFALEPQLMTTDPDGRPITSVPMTEAHRALLDGLRHHPLSFKELGERLAALGGHQTPQQLVTRLIERGRLTGSDASGQPVHVNFGLRFKGVGAEDQVE